MNKSSIKIDKLETEYLKYANYRQNSISNISCFNSAKNCYLPLIDISILNNTSNIFDPHKIRSIIFRSHKNITNGVMRKAVSNNLDILGIVLFYFHEVHCHRFHYISSTISIPISFMNYTLNMIFRGFVNTKDSNRRDIYHLAKYVSSNIHRLLESARIVFEGFAIFREGLFISSVLSNLGLNEEERGKLSLDIIKNSLSYLQGKEKWIYQEGLAICVHIYRNWGLDGLWYSVRLVLNPIIDDLLLADYDPFLLLRNIADLSSHKKPRNILHLRQRDKPAQLIWNRFLRKYFPQSSINLSTKLHFEVFLKSFPFIRLYKWKLRRSLALYECDVDPLPGQILVLNRNQNVDFWMNNISNYSLFSENLFITLLREQIFFDILKNRTPINKECLYKKLVHDCDRCNESTNNFGKSISSDISRKLGINICP